MKSYVPINFVPVEDEGLHLQVVGMIGEQMVRFVVDTGASHSILASERVDRLFADSIGRSKVDLDGKGLGQEVESFLIEVDELRIGKKFIQSYTAALLDLSPINELMSTYKSTLIDGILGGDLLSHMRSSIHYKKEYITIYNKKRDLRRVYYPDRSFHFVVDLDINDHGATLLLDTGASKSVFDKERFSQFVSYESSDLRYNDKPGTGIHFEQTEHQTIWVDSLAFGYLTVPPFEILIMNLENVNSTYARLGLPPVDGIIGNDLLDKLRAIIDYESKILRLKD